MRKWQHRALSLSMDPTEYLERYFEEKLKQLGYSKEDKFFRDTKRNMLYVEAAQALVDLEVSLGKLLDGRKLKDNNMFLKSDLNG